MSKLFKAAAVAMFSLLLVFAPAAASIAQAAPPPAPVAAAVVTAAPAPAAITPAPAAPRLVWGWWCKWGHAAWYFTTNSWEVQWNRWFYGYWSCVNGQARI